VLWSQSQAPDAPKRVQEDTKRGVTTVEPITYRPVKDMNTVIEQLRYGLENRSIAATEMNEASSRAHTIFQLHIKTSSRVRGRGGASRFSTLTFVDLAGSERLSKSKTTGARACALPLAVPGPLCGIAGGDVSTTASL
jgi:hypothetical protein